MLHQTGEWHPLVTGTSWSGGSPGDKEPQDTIRAAKGKTAGFSTQELHFLDSFYCCFDLGVFFFAVLGMAFLKYIHVYTDIDTNTYI
jgi:hypothetical protein